MRFSVLKFGFVLALIIFVSGCSMLSGRGTGIWIDEQQQDSTPPANNSPQIPLTDGFDFPVGDRNGRGWAVTGYDFMQWSNVSNSWHPGEDWNIPHVGNGDFGKPVYSVANGVVVFSGWNTAQGNIITIEHHLPNGTKVWSQYAHLDRRLVQQGEIVGRRQQIGTVGRGPNNRFIAHLHFEIRRTAMPSNAWPRTAGQPWTKAQTLQHWLHPSEFIRNNRP